MIKLNLAETALVVIDLENSIAHRAGLQPYSGETIIERNNQLANRLKNTAATIVLVRVKNQGPEAMRSVTAAGASASKPLQGEEARYCLDVADDSAAANVVKVAKHNWGAFYGTDLDVQLRRRGITTIILTGISTAIGVDTTAREAVQHNYELITVPEAMTDTHIESHEASVNYIFPRLGRVVTMAEILTAIATAE